MLDIKPFFKKTNKFQYLQFDSAHPRNTFSSLIRGEMTRLLRSCSDEATYKSIQAKMHDIFLDRGYPRSLITNTMHKLKFSDRAEKLKDRNREQCSYDTFLVTEYSSDLNTRELNRILKPDTSELMHVPKPCLRKTT